MRLFGITPLELNVSTVQRQLSGFELIVRGIRAADALHVATALAFDADLLISTDQDILQLDRVLSNTSGNQIRCLDSDQALDLL